ncbi:MAG: transcriptional repressor LexA [Eubacteriales bacterium]
MEVLTPQEKAAYDYISRTIEKSGYAPSVRDIKDAIGVKSTSTVHSYLEKLEKKGYIIKEQGKSRTIRTREKQEEPTAKKIPILGQVAAGMPILAVENCEGYIDFCPSRKIGIGDELFALRIKGESMIEAGIMNGDCVIVSRTSYVENGDIAVVLIDDEATVKTFYRENGIFRLQPENSRMKPIIVKNVHILGKVIANVRYYE